MRSGSPAVRPLARVVALVFVLLVAGVAIGSGGGVATSSAADGGLTMWVQLDASGNATWNVTTTVAVENQSDRQAFERLAESFESGDGGASFSVGAFRAAAREAGEATGRDMAIRDVEREAALENRTGRLTLRFEWTNFANATGAQLRVDDAFETPGGTWLPGLDAGQRLVVEPPPGYSAESASAGARVTDGRFEWTGPERFGPDQPFGVYRNPDIVTSESPTDPGPELPAALPLVGGAAIVLAVLGIGVGVYLWTRRDAGTGPAAEATTTDGTGDDGADGEPVAPTTADAAGDTDDGHAGTGAATAGAGADATDGVDEALLSDEERVERMLADNGGRMKQADIVDETNWSDAKVSQLLSEMADDGRVEKLRMGRENIISLPGEDVGEFDH